MDSRQRRCGGRALLLRNLAIFRLQLASAMRAEIQWIDRGREPQCAPNPAYPLGIDVDLSEGVTRTCKTHLPYPAKRCGVWMVKCLDCGYVGACTTAGRVDDPRTLTMPCKSLTQ